MIDLKKKYETKNRLEVVLYEIVGDKVFGRYFSSVGSFWIPYIWYADTGNVVEDYTDNHALVEVNPYRDFVIDEPVVVSDDGKNWLRRHFAGVDREGNPLAWRGGFTEWTSEDLGKTSWKYCRRPTEQELNNVYSRNKTD